MLISKIKHLCHADTEINESLLNYLPSKTKEGWFPLKEVMNDLFPRVFVHGNVVNGAGTCIAEHAIVYVTCRSAFYPDSFNCTLSKSKQVVGGFPLTETSFFFRLLQTDRSWQVIRPSHKNANLMPMKSFQVKYVLPTIHLILFLKFLSFSLGCKTLQRTLN